VLKALKEDKDFKGHKELLEMERRELQVQLERRELRDQQGRL
jgi:hypothetical protein